MPTISDEFMDAELARTQTYTLAFLKPGPNYRMEGRGLIVWEHGRRNLALRADGRLAIVGPVTDGAEIKGAYIFNTPPDETYAILADDPAVLAGIFVFEVHPLQSFPGDRLGG